MFAKKVPHHRSLERPPTKFVPTWLLALAAATRLFCSSCRTLSVTSMRSNTRWVAAFAHARFAASSPLSLDFRVTIRAAKCEGSKITHPWRRKESLIDWNIRAYLSSGPRAAFCGVCGGLRSPPPLPDKTRRNEQVKEQRTLVPKLRVPCIIAYFSKNGNGGDSEQKLREIILVSGRKLVSFSCFVDSDGTAPVLGSKHKLRCQRHFSCLLCPRKFPLAGSKVAGEPPAVVVPAFRAAASRQKFIVGVERGGH